MFWRRLRLALCGVQAAGVRASGAAATDGRRRASRSQERPGHLRLHAGFANISGPSVTGVADRHPRVLLILSADCDPTRAVLQASEIATQNEARLAIAVIDAVVAWPRLVDVDPGFWVSLSNLREDTLCRAVGLVSDEIALTVIDTPDWHSVLNELSRSDLTAIVCAVRGGWSRRLQHLASRVDAAVPILIAHN
jgi:hypothetical protein